MKIVFLQRYYAPAWGYGGVVRAAYGLASALVEQGHDLVVVTTDAGDGGQRVPEQAAVVDGVRVIRCRNAFPALLKLNLSSPVGMGAALREELQDADILHMHELRTVENLIGLREARRANVPVVVSPHGTLGYQAGRGRAKQFWDVLLGRWQASRIDHVAALTDDEADDVRALWGQWGRKLHYNQLSVVPNGVNLAEFAELPPGDGFRTRWHIPADAPLVLFMARLHARKGAHILVDAIHHLPEAWLAIVGPDEGQGAALRERAKARGDADRVVFTGLLTGEDKLAALAGAEVLALPAVGEGLPIVALEALAAGLPVALSDGCHLPEVFAAGAGVRLERLQGKIVARALAPVLTDPALRQAMGERGKSLVAGYFTWEAAASQMVNVYGNFHTQH